MRLLMLILLLAGTTGSASAEPDSEARNRVSFQVEAMREVANDWATARLTVAAEGKDPAVVADSVNRAMSAALATAKGTRDMTVESGAYMTQPVYDDGRVVRWRANQELRVESGDVDGLAHLIGNLQGDKVLLSSIHFSVRPETRKGVEDELIEESLAAFKARAQLITRGLGAKDWSLIALSVNQAGGPPRIMHARMESDMMSMSRAAPAAFEAGMSEVRVSVNGSIELD